MKRSYQFSIVGRTSKAGAYSFFFLLFVLFSCKKSKDGSVDEKPRPIVRLDYIEVEEHATGGHLYLYGSFGDSSSTSKIKINDSWLSTDPTTLNGHIISWKTNLIKCAIQTATSAIGHGKISVYNGGGKSSERILNVWEGDIIFTRPDAGSIKREIRFHVYLRADANTHPAISYLFTPQSSFASTSKAHYSVGGQGSSTYNDGSCLVSMTASLSTASGTIPIRIPFKNSTGIPEYFQCKMRFKNGKFEIKDLDVWKKDVSTRTILVQSCPGSSTSNFSYSLPTLHSGLKDFELEFEPNTKIIKAGQKTAQGSTEMGLIWNNGQVPQYGCSIKWDRMIPRYPS
jgi:hypothetical protein